MDGAIDDLRYYTRDEVRTSAFTAVSGGVVDIGATALGTSYIASRQTMAVVWFMIWVADAMLSAAISGVAMGTKGSGGRK